MTTDKKPTSPKIANTSKRYLPPPTTTAPVGLEDPKEINFPVANVEYGRSGVRRFGMFVLDDFLQDLQSSSKQIQVYREMSENDAIIGAMIFAIKMLCRGVRWYVTVSEDEEKVEDTDEKVPEIPEKLLENPDDLNADPNAAPAPKPKKKEKTPNEIGKEFLESSMEDMERPWVDVINESLTMLVFGWAVQEIVYKQRVGPEEQDPTKFSNYKDNLISWRKISLRAQDTLFGWQFAENGSNDVVAMRQMSPPDYKITDIPLIKCIHFVTESGRGNPQGRSPLRNSVVSWKIRHNIELIEAMGIERDLVGYPLLRIPGSVLNDPEARAEYESLVSGVKRDEREGIILPSDVWTNAEGTPSGVRQYDFELISSGGTRQIDTNAIITRWNTLILSTMLADMIQLGHEGTGSYALSESKTNTFVSAIDAYLDIICEAFNRQAIPRLFSMNPELRKKIKKLPKLNHDHIKGTDLNIIGNYLKSLKMAGIPIVLSNDLMEFLYDIADLPRGSEEEVTAAIKKLDAAAQAKAQGGQFGAPGGQPGVPQVPNAITQGGKPGLPQEEGQPPVGQDDPARRPEEDVPEIPPKLSEDPGQNKEPAIAKMSIPKDEIETSDNLDNKIVKIMGLSKDIAIKAIENMKKGDY